MCYIEPFSCKGRNPNSNNFRQKKENGRRAWGSGSSDLRSRVRALEWGQKSFFCSDSDPGFCLAPSLPLQTGRLHMAGNLWGAGHQQAGVSMCLGATRQLVSPRDVWLLHPRIQPTLEPNYLYFFLLLLKVTQSRLTLCDTMGFSRPEYWGG